MNHHDIAKKIVSRLDEGTANLDRRVISQLQQARRTALARQAKKQTVFGFAWATSLPGKSGSHSHPFSHLWLPVGVLLLGLMVITAWQSFNASQEDPVAEIDASLLAADLPFTAYLDNGFDKWLERSSQQH